MLPSSLTIIYASTSGNTEAVVEYVAEVWRAQSCQVTCMRAEKATVAAIHEQQHFLLATSTWEHGELNPFFHRLFGEMAELDLSQKKAAFIGLGDRRYEPVLFCQGMEKVRQRWLEQGGQQIGEALRIQGEPFKILTTEVKTWAEHIAQIWPSEKHPGLLSSLKKALSL